MREDVPLDMPEPEGSIVPADPQAIEAEMRPVAKRLAALLRVTPAEAHWRAAEVGRFSLRQEWRTPDTPCLEFVPRKTAEGVALGLLVDISGSMIKRMQEVIKALIAFILTCQELEDVALEIVAFPGDVHILEYRDRGNARAYERAKALTAGLRAGGETPLECYLPGSIKRLSERPEPRKLLLVIHDGAPDDPEKCEEQLRRPPVPVWGLFLTETEDDPWIEVMREIFWGKLIVGPASRLDRKLANILKGLRM